MEPHFLYTIKKMLSWHDYKKSKIRCSDELDFLDEGWLRATQVPSKVVCGRMYWTDTEMEMIQKTLESLLPPDLMKLVWEYQPKFLYQTSYTLTYFWGNMEIEFSVSLYSKHILTCTFVADYLGQVTMKSAQSFCFTHSCSNLPECKCLITFLGCAQNWRIGTWRTASCTFDVLEIEWREHHAYFLEIFLKCKEKGRIHLW